MFQTKNNKSVLPSKICFYAFSVKRKENDLQRKYIRLGSSAN